MPKLIYVATNFDNYRRARQFIAFFKSFDIVPSFDWTPFADRIYANNLPRETDHGELSRKAIFEVAGLETCAYLMVILPGGSGTNFELGVCYRRFIDRPESMYYPLPITILDETPGSLVSFHHLPNINYTNSVAIAVTRVLKYFGVSDLEIGTALSSQAYSELIRPSLESRTCDGPASSQ